MLRERNSIGGERQGNLSLIGIYSKVDLGVAFLSQKPSNGVADPKVNASCPGSLNGDQCTSDEGCGEDLCRVSAISGVSARCHESDQCPPQFPTSRGRRSPPKRKHTGNTRTFGQGWTCRAPEQCVSMAGSFRVQSSCGWYRRRLSSEEKETSSRGTEVV